MKEVGETQHWLTSWPQRLALCGTPTAEPDVNPIPTRRSRWSSTFTMCFYLMIRRFFEIGWRPGRPREGNARFGAKGRWRWPDFYRRRYRCANGREIYSARVRHVWRS